MLKLSLKIICIFFCVISPLTAFSNPMKFKLLEGTPQCKGCLIVQADGDITENTAKSFASFIKKNTVLKDKDSTIVLNSPGGNLAGGLKLGELIRKNRLNTHIASFDKSHSKKYSLIKGKCASACAYAFLGGNRRSMEIDSKYGLHQISTQSKKNIHLDEAVRTTQNMIAIVTKYVEHMGASTGIVTVATRTSDKSINWLDASELTNLKAVNSSGLVVQRPWEKFRPTNWANWSVMPDGSRNLWLIGCKEIPRTGTINLSISLPKNKSLLNDYFKVKIKVNMNDVPIIEKTGTQYHSLMPTLDIPASTIRKAIQTDSTLNIEIDYPKEFQKYFYVGEHPMPLMGLNKALNSLATICPHLNFTH